jgi:hypothetical protein
MPLGGRFAALEPEYDSPQYITADETLYDLSSGKARDLADVSWDWNGEPIVYGLDFLALDSSGFTAWRETNETGARAHHRRVVPIVVPVRRWRRGGQHLELDEPDGRASRMEHRWSVVK